MECKNTSSVSMSEWITESCIDNITMHEKTACGIETRFSFIRISPAAFLAILFNSSCIFLSSSEKRIGKSVLSRSCKLNMVVANGLSDWQVFAESCKPCRFPVLGHGTRQPMQYCVLQAIGFVLPPCVLRSHSVAHPVPVHCCNRIFCLT